MTHQNQLLKDVDVAEAIRVSRRQVWKLEEARLVPAPVRVGGSVRWRRSDIDFWMDLGCPDRATFNLRKAKRDEGDDR